MNEPVTVTIPLINPNEPEALVAAVHVRQGQAVSAGDLLCTLETTKSTAEVLAEGSGYVSGLHFAQGQTARAGDVFCYLAPDPSWEPGPEILLPPPTSTELPPGLRISQPALALARESRLDLSLLPVGPLVTASAVRQVLVGLTSRAEGSLEFSPPESPFDPTAIIVYGGGGHGKSLIDLLRLLGTYRIVGIVDDGLSTTAQVMGLPVLGGGEVLPELYHKGFHLAVNAVGGIGNVAIRIIVFQRLAGDGFTCPAVVHPTAFIEPSAMLSPGVQVFPHAYVGSETRIGFGAIVNTGAIVSHDCLVGDYANLSPGCVLAGEVKIGSGALIGMRATVNLRTVIGKGARVGNGATVKSDVPEGGVVRAGTIWPA